MYIPYLGHIFFYKSLTAYHTPSQKESENHRMEGANYMTTQKMSTRKMLETLVRKCSERKIYSVKVIDIEDGAVFEARHPIDLIFTTAKTWNYLWVLEVLSFKIVENQVLVIINSGIPQSNGDPDFPVRTV